jgi:predicted metalloprotease with PDZ domain
MSKIFTVLLMTFCAAGLVYASDDVGPYDWKINYKFELVNPARKLIQVEAEYTFPSMTDEVVLQMDDEDNHYTEGYRRHLRAFQLKDSEGNNVEFITDTTGLYRATGLKGTYTASYIVVLDHISKAQSKLGPDDTPIMWGRLAVFPGASVVIFPWDVGRSRIGSIEVSFKLPEGASFLTPYEKIGENRYSVPSIALLKSEFWAVGAFDSFVYEKGGDSVICSVSREGPGFQIDDIRPKVDSIFDYFTNLLGALPAHKISMSVIATPSSQKTPGFHSFGSVGQRSFSCLIDEKVSPAELGSQMGLVAYNALSFWTPGHFRPVSRVKLDWFTTAALNYMQLKSMLHLGFIDEAEFLGNLARTYNTYREDLKRKGLSLSVMMTLPNSPDRSVYGLIVCVMFDFLLHSRTDGEQSLENVLRTLNEMYGGTTGYTEEDLYRVFRDAGLADIDDLISKHVTTAGLVDLEELLKPYGLIVRREKSGTPDIGLRLRGDKDLTIEWVDGEGAAKEAGLEFGDILSEVRGFKMSDASDLPKLISKLRPGSEVDVVYVRDGEKKSATIVLGSRMLYRIAPKANASDAEKNLWAKFLQP